MRSVKALSRIGELIEAEVSSERCQELEEGFYRRAYSELLSIRRSIPDSEPGRSIIVDLIREAQEALRLLFMIRVIKGLMATVLGVDDERLTEAERKAVRDVYEAAYQHAAAVIPEVSAKEIGEKVVVIFERDSVEVIGPRMKVYGPFRRGDLAYIPAELAAALKSEGACREEKVNVE